MIRADNFRPLPKSLAGHLRNLSTIVETMRSRRPSGPLPTDEDWWLDVLHDRRAYLPVTETSFDNESRYANYRLDHQRGDTIAFTCACGLGRVIDKAELIDGLGPSANVLWVARHVIIDCERRNKVSNLCRAYPVR